ncbi:GNAT family N-acetyltransferase [Clostridium senegalense]
MLIDEKIVECETKYIQCFSDSYEDKSIIRFRDNELKDMYYHNYTYIKNSMSENELRNIIKNEISLRLCEEENYCNILSNYNINSSLISSLKYDSEISINGYYTFDIEYFSRLKAIPDCIVKKVSNEKMVNDILYCDLQHDEKTLGKDFCTRRSYRRGKVYISDKGVNSYLCYHNGQVVGNCDLFIYKGIAKIEDFDVIPRYQRKGYGTTILKSLINTAIKEKCHTIYLITDEEDTAKEMYKKIGFSKIGERIDLFLKLY